MAGQQGWISESTRKKTPSSLRFILKIKPGSKTKLQDPKCLNSRVKFYGSSPSLK